MHLTAVLIDRGYTAEAQRRLVELSSLIPEPERPFFLGALNARLATARGEAGLAYRMYMKVLGQSGFPGSRMPRLHRMVYGVARAALASGDAVAADSLARHALRLQRELGQEETRSGDMGSSLLLLARARLAQGDSVGGGDALQRAQRPLEHGLGRDHPRTVEARTLLKTLSLGITTTNTAAN